MKMKTPNITPGPWRWVGSKGKPNERLYLSTPAGYADWNNGTPESEANAKAIAALPDVLAALNDILLRAVRQQANGGDIYDFQDALRECADKARAALKKAGFGE